MPEKKTSRLSGFYAKPLTERIAAVSEWAELSVVETATLSGGLTPALANQMVENAIGMFALPFGIGVNLLINGRDYLAPMAVEEPSVIAAVGNAARLARAGGGFQTGSTPSVMMTVIVLVALSGTRMRLSQTSQGESCRILPPSSSRRTRDGLKSKLAKPD